MKMKQGYLTITVFSFNYLLQSFFLLFALFQLVVAQFILISSLLEEENWSWISSFNSQQK